MRVVLVVISVLTSISLQLKDGIGAQDGDFTAGIFGRELPADAPAEYREDYLLAPSSISPDKKLALIYPKEGDEFPTQPESGTADNYLVTLDPFRILGALPVAYFENINHKGLSVNWAKDSSAAVIVSQGKWSPRCVIAFELKEGQIAAPPAIKSTQVATRKLTGFISRVYDRRSLIDNNISAIASARGFAPRFPLPWTRTLTASASMSRLPITNMVWTFNCSARWILPLI